MEEQRTAGPAGHETASEEMSNARAADLTGIFRQVKVRGAEDRPTPPASAAEAEDGGERMPFTQMFEAWSGRARALLGEDRLQAPVAASSAQHGDPGRGEEEDAPGREPQRTGTSDFTEMFWQVPAAPGAFSMSSSSRAHLEPAPLSSESLQVGGGFTQLLRTLSDEGSRELLPGEAALPGVAARPHGPGEFTRIISRSAMRDAQLREQQPAPVESEGERQLTPAGTSVTVPQPAAAMPAATPAFEASAAAPIPPEAAPHAPRAKGAAALDEYLPVLVIANLFLTVLTLILVAALLMRGAKGVS